LVSGKPQAKQSDEEALTKQEDTIEQLRAQLKEMEKAKLESDRKAKEYLEKLQRLQADMENLQKITRRQVESITRGASRDLTAKLLPILDALRQAGKYAHDGEPLPTDEVAVGLDMLHKQLMDVLKTEGLEEISTVGKLLDPERHEVVNYVERDDVPENTIVEEVRKGYLLNGRALRPAMVIVTKPKTSPKTEPSKSSP
jgi:molecular chaperone GrpE